MKGFVLAPGTGDAMEIEGVVVVVDVEESGIWGRLLRQGNVTRRWRYIYGRIGRKWKPISLD